jgi:hypothetical protein
MNCKEIKYFLLGCENPDRPPADVKAHLAVCHGCQDWQNRLALIEMNIPFLPVPASAARAQLLRKVLSQPRLVVGDDLSPVAAAESSVETRVALKDTVAPVSRTIEPKSPIVLTTERSWPRRGAGLLHFFRDLEPSARRYAAGGLAAAILLVIFGWMVIRTPRRPPTPGSQLARSSSDPLLASIIERDLRLAGAERPSARFLALADLADDLSGEVKKLAPLPEAKGVLEELVKRYQQVVRQGLLEVAGKLPRADRDDLLNTVGERLHVAGRTADELGEQLGAKIPNSSRDALRRLTKAAYEGDRQLRDLRVQNLQQEPGNIRPRDGSALVRRDNP